MDEGRRERALIAVLTAVWPVLATQAAHAQEQPPDEERPEERPDQRPVDRPDQRPDERPDNAPGAAEPGPLDEPSSPTAELPSDGDPALEEPSTAEARRLDERRRLDDERATAARWAKEEALQRRPPGRMVDRMTAAMPGAHAMVGINHRGDPMLAVELQLGGVAAIGYGYDDRLLGGATAQDAEVQGRYNAWFRLGVPAGRWFAQQPALDLTFERTDGDGEAQAAELRLGATRSWRARRIGVIDLTAGLGLWEVAGNGARLSDRPLSERLRPYGGIAWTPPSYPRTSLLLEGSFGPSVIDGAPRLDWRLGWGARYQVFSWSAIDLVVRNRQDAGLPGSTVMVRLSAQLD